MKTNILRAVLIFTAITSALAPGLICAQQIPDAPNWKSVDRPNPGLTQYLDFAHIVRTGDTSTIWSLQDFPVEIQPTKIASSHYKSIRYQVEYNCLTDIHRALFYATYSGSMGHGNLVSGGPISGSWTPVAPDEELAREVACHPEVLIH